MKLIDVKLINVKLIDVELIAEHVSYADTIDSNLNACNVFQLLCMCITINKSNHFHLSIKQCSLNFN